MPINFERNTPPNKTRLETESKVYAMFKESGRKMSVRDAHELFREQNAENPRFNRITERTVRRAIDNLVKTGYLTCYGRDSGADIYGIFAASFDALTGNENMIPFASELVPVSQFIRMIVEPDNHPFRVKRDILDDNVETTIRKMLAFVVVTSGSTGFHDQLKVTQRDLQKFLNEIDHIRVIVKAILDSPVWYDQHRDRIALGVREMQKNNPELFQLALDFVKGG